MKKKSSQTFWSNGSLSFFVLLGELTLRPCFGAFFPPATPGCGFQTVVASTVVGWSPPSPLDPSARTDNEILQALCANLDQLGNEDFDSRAAAQTWYQDSMAKLLGDLPYTS